MLEPRTGLGHGPQGHAEHRAADDFVAFGPHQLGEAVVDIHEGAAAAGENGERDGAGAEGLGEALLRTPQGLLNRDAVLRFPLHALVSGLQFLAQCVGLGAGAFVSTDLDLQSFVRLVKFPRAQQYPLLQFQLSLAQRRITRLDLHEHFIEAVHEPAQLVLAALGHADGVVFFDGDRAGGLGQVGQRLRNEPLQPGGEQEADAGRSHQHQQSEPQGPSAALPQFHEVGLKDHTTQRPAILLHRLGDFEMVVAKGHLLNRKF